MKVNEAHDVSTMTASPPVPRQCGRCRLFFPGEVAPDPATPKWWLCTACRTAFFGADDGAKRSSRWG